MSNLNKFSKNITQSKKNGSAQAMLYALGFDKNDLKKAQIGIGTVWFEGNPCNAKLDRISKLVKDSTEARGFLGMRYNTIGISDGKTMGTDAMRYSLPSRELIADSMESIINGEHYDASILVPGCDKNLPASAMALARVNRPGFIIYGGSMKPTFRSGKNNIEKLDIVSSFEAYGKYLKGEISDIERQDIIEKSCDINCGSCSGFYTANTMACLLEVMGLTLPNSSSNMSLSNEKIVECHNSGDVIKKLIIEDIKPLDIMTKESFLNAVKFLTIIGGSTNGVIHLLAMAKTAGVDLTLEDFKKYENLPVLTNMKPHGEFVMDDLYKKGGTSSLIRYLIEKDILNGDCMTVTTKTLWENNYKAKEMQFRDSVIYPLESPFKDSSHIKILKGNMAKQGAISKINSKFIKNNYFEGKARVYDSEDEMLKALENDEIKTNNFIILRYQGESIGCPEMLTPTSALIGYFNSLNTSIPPFATDGRFSGGSTGILIGHLPDAFKDKSITALIKNDDMISINLDTNNINLDVSDEELLIREKNIKKPELKLIGYLDKYRKLVSNINDGYLT